MTSTARIGILPREVSAEVVTSAVARGGWAVAVLVVVIDIPVLVDVLAARGILNELPLPLAALIVMIALAVITGVWATPLTRIAYVVGASACAVAFMVVLLRIDPTIAGDNTFVLNRPAVALVLLAPLTLRPLVGLLWATAGLVVSLVSVGVAAWISGETFMPGWGTFAAWAIYSSAYLVLTVVRRSQQATIPDLGRLEGETRRLALESQFEQRAAAVIHDTVLSDLTAVMNAAGPLDEKARDRFRADVATLKNPTWLREAAAAALDIDDQDAAVRNGTVALVSAMQWRGLTVDVTGTNDSIVRMSPRAMNAVHAALKVCFENVIDHSGTKTAELVASGSETELTYMVIDHGDGFDTVTVLPEARSLRETIADIEGLGGSMRVWSQPGSGTSVLITMPQGANDAS